MFLSKKSVLLFTFLISFIFVVQLCYSDETQEEVEAMSSDSVAQLQNSLYAQINLSFQIVKPILEYSCYDCHSANTQEPWYFNIPGINSFVTSHVKEGREHLDFTDGFPFKSKEPILEILHELKEEVEEGEMPLLSYRIMHWGRLIEDEKQDSLFQWIEKTEIALKEFYDFNNISYKKEKSE